MRVLRYQKDIKGEFLIAVSAELFIHLSFITLYNDSEMKGKTRGGERDRGVGACGLGMAGVCRALVSPEGNGASSSPPRFPVRSQIGGKAAAFCPPQLVAEVTLVPKNPATKLFKISLRAAKSCGFCLMIQDTNRIGRDVRRFLSPESPVEKRRMLGVNLLKCVLVFLSLSSLVLLLGDRGA